MNLLYAVSRALAALGLFGLTLLSDAAAPRASFVVSSGAPSAGAPVQFTDTSSSSPKAWLWNFGDGTTSNLPNPTHVFPGEGFFPVTLQITDAGGAAQSTTTVEVLPAGTLRLLSQTGHPFEVTFQATDPRSGISGAGQAVPQNDAFGYFTVPAFAPPGTAQPPTPEVFVKMHDDRAAGMDFSVFWGGLTDLGYTLTIRDTVTGATKVKQFPSTSGPACLGVDTSGFQSARSAHMVNIGAGSNSFQDVTSGTAKTTVQVGETVQWTWMSGPHSTTSGTCTSGGGGGYYGGGGPDCTSSGVWDSTQHTAGYQYSHTFTTPGTYKYYCAVHGSSMVGTVEVHAATETTPTVTPTPGGPTPTPGTFGVAERTLGGESSRPPRTVRNPERPVPTAGAPQPTHTPTPTAGGPTPTPTPTPTAQAGQTVHVTVGNDFFRDASSGNSTTTIAVGTTIQWDFQGHHTTTSGPCPPCAGDGTWNSTPKNSGDSFTHTFTTAGTFPYFCGIHLTMMTGTVVVNPQ